MDRTSEKNIDLKLVWRKMANEKFLNKEFEKKEIMNALTQESNSTVVELRKNLKQKLNWFVGLIGVLIVVNISTFFTQKDFFFYLVFTTMYIIGYFLTRRKYRLMSEEKLDSQSILSYLKSNRAAIKSALQVERIWGICAILLAAVYYINVGDVYMLNNPIGITIFLLIIVIFGFWAEWMNHKKFGRRIKNLEENIIRLETLS